jgi:hypothetical protein
MRAGAAIAETSKSDVVATLLDLHGRTYAAELGFDTDVNSPSVLFRLLCALLFSARIRASIGVAAAKALADQGWITARKMADASWAARAQVLNEAGYARYDERTSRWLGETAVLLRDRYDGDLRQLREEAGRDPSEQRRLLKECKGLGDTGVDIFFREVQGVWGELYPFADERALDGAEALGLERDPRQLSKLVNRKEFPRLVAALVRVRLDGDADRIRRAAEEGGPGDGAAGGVSKSKLYARTQKLQISGRSKMTKSSHG